MHLEAWRKVLMTLWCESCEDIDDDVAAAGACSVQSNLPYANLQCFSYTGLVCICMEICHIFQGKNMVQYIVRG